MTNTETAVFGMGCFWSAEELFRKIKGVISTEVGFMGGTVKNPTYGQVCRGKSGHIEVVNITYNPKIVKYTDLLNLFWNNHDPTTPNRQGWDVGEQYSSHIFYFTEEQRLLAEKSFEKIQKSSDLRIVTAIKKASDFFPAEEYHQKYFMKKNNSILNF
ncbi:peptide methionine sulfoxide reductase [Methanococcus maripaludis C5]|uniref:Peptide methionine sulfoxide reductase MsrA n=1 Tax=Methanococcus maripaludis (strain C5 / ATCC BAA-1333) TaxID=402880 RepID=MSRA_METM5|nr:peptide-methionine (S)-S-oxide reductase MsrA [Methanococcus maripaludis]A4FYX5.1 RecName: Full=Peptide methionine sulfoxide reductase MsrA; Short=Protein-methionine-S-oxide reductase; AltName: Full=Peptide-methionine (S)-S-oxide reductase; Short=Peptide Met(O) reductase [Methanococcus maripaludis C5]ABO35409.1 peptide methionine sulfoxide reductase [Methanococcus maripaludis C5]